MDIVRKILPKRFLWTPHSPQPTMWPLLDACGMQPGIRPQPQSPLFEKLSAEIRLALYQAALANFGGFMHICKNWTPKKGKKLRQVAHFCCIDMDSPYPTWQHTCYGERQVTTDRGTTGFRYRPVTETDDKLLSLLLTCRLIFSEALPVLYHDNIFHFRGAPPLLAFHSALSPVQWHAIRHIHISTFFNDESSCGNWDKPKHWPPESMSEWLACCIVLNQLPALRSLFLDVIVHLPDPEFPVARRQSILHEILGPLASVAAKKIEIELNIEPDEVWDAWGPGGEDSFEIVCRKRAYNEKLYDLQPKLMIDYE